MLSSRRFGTKWPSYTKIGKPFTRRRTSRRTLAATIALSGLIALLLLGFGEPFPPLLAGGILGSQTQVHKSRREAISDAFQHAWDGYAQHCFGHDTLRPVSNTCEDDFGGWGATALDSLSTAIIMRKDGIATQIMELIAELDLDTLPHGSQIQVFETTIRHFGGMISAWDLLHGPFGDMVKNETLRAALYGQMVKLGEKLACSFSPAGIPHDWLNPSTCKTDSGTRTALTNAGTMILEFGRLSAITGNRTYADLAERAESYLLQPEPADNEPFPGLLGSYVDISDGHITDFSGSWGAMSDSFYEYLLKAYIFDSKSYSHYLDRWLAAADSTIRYIGSHPYGHPEWTLLPMWNGQSLTRKMETLSWFAGGSFILGGMVTKNHTLLDFGLSIASTAGHIYDMTASGLGGEFVTWRTHCDEDDETCGKKTSLQTTDARYQLRPEVLETWYHAYRATHNRTYMDWSWSAFEAINKTCRTETGFSSISNVSAEDGGYKTDKQETFVFAEVFKYLYLLHLDDPSAAYQIQDSRTGKKNTWVFNTEAHPLRVVGEPV